MRIVFVLAGLIAVLVIAAACGDDDGGPDATPTAVATATATDVSAYPLTITDDAGVELTFEEVPDSIVALAPSFVEVLFAVGAGDAIVAADDNTDYPPEAESIPKISGFSPSVEGIVAFEPDLVLIFFDPGDLQSTLLALDVPVMFLDTPSTIDGVYDQIEILGDATGHAAEADELIASMRVAVSEVTESVEGLDGPTFFHEVDNTYYTAGPGSFIADLYDELGAENIAESTGQASLQMSAEAIISADPQVIILADEDAGESPETVAARPGWDVIAAVMDGRVHVVNPDIISRPGPRLVEALETLAGLLYPEVLD